VKFLGQNFQTLEHKQDRQTNTQRDATKYIILAASVSGNNNRSQRNSIHLKTDILPVVGIALKILFLCRLDVICTICTFFNCLGCYHKSEVLKKDKILLVCSLDCQCIFHTLLLVPRFRTWFILLRYLFLVESFICDIFVTSAVSTLCYQANQAVSVLLVWCTSRARFR